MKKLFATVLTVGMLMLASVSAFAAEPAGTYTCPNGNKACTTNGACLNNGVCVAPYTCPNGYEACTTNGACLNNGVCGGGGHGHGRGHCGR